MADELGLEADRALVELRRLIAQVYDLEGEYRDSAREGFSDDMGFAREWALWRVLEARFQDAHVVHRANVEDEETGARFGQRDVVLADRRVPPHRMTRSGRAVLDPRAVHTSVEVKSVLSGPVLFDALGQVARAQEVPRRRVGEVYLEFATSSGSVPYVPTMGGVFAYRSKLRISTIAARLVEWTEGRPAEQWPRFVTVLDRGHVMWCDPGTGVPLPWPHQAAVPLILEHRAGETDRTAPLTALITHLDWLASVWHVPGTPFVRGERRLPFGIGVGIMVRPPGVPEPAGECGHLCANCHESGRMSFAEQRRRNGLPPEV
ncbi:DUF6602 domain-containing protein [Streptomyces sp. CBMA156]|uniref:DUF6602 domain-containing protein n=1 Tax=Streptomyces sp. CBMA156 TaxID=1930280 RepID=UPI001661AC70|nr:DUF6602 domain-containing protein [Streptomyces sp. CBMA156]MBD0671543.1 hypothetical protein [Streptomyces sp. CBMA156]